PLASSGVGIFCNPSPGTHVGVGFGYRNQPYILSTISPRGFFATDLGENPYSYLSATSMPVPDLNSGEFILKGLDRSYLKFENDGDIILNFGFSGMTFSSKNILIEKVLQEYVSTDAAFEYNGRIKRETVPLDNYTLTDR